MVALYWEHSFKHIWQKYNRIYKMLQYLMGRSDIGATLNAYTHLGFEDAQEGLKRGANGE